MAHRLQNVSLEEIAEHTAEIAAEMEAGHTLRLVRGGKRIADIVPCRPEPTKEQREQARKELLALLEKGLHLGGVPPTRDEMHER